MNRLRSAFRTNSTQCETVLMLSALNGLAAIGSDSWTLAIGAVLFWPCVALLGNFIHPIPPK